MALSAACSYQFLTSRLKFIVQRAFTFHYAMLTMSSINSRVWEYSCILIGVSTFFRFLVVVLVMVFHEIGSDLLSNMVKLEFIW